MQDWAGWLLLFSSFFIVRSFREVRKDRSVVTALFFILALHHIAAITNAYIVILPGAGDAEGFFSKAMIMADSDKITFGMPYIRILSVVFMVLGSSCFLGAELSVLAFTFSCIVFIKIVNIIDVRRHRVWLLMLYGLLPSIIIYTSVGLREAYQILFLMLVIYCGLRVHLKPMNGARLFTMLSGFLLSMFHYALGILTIILIPILLLWQPQKRSIAKRFTISKRRFINIILVIIFLLGGFYFCTRSPNEGVLIGFEYLNYIRADYKGFLMNLDKVISGAARTQGRTNYGKHLDLDSIESVIRTMPVSLAYYLFTPSPWNIRNFMDIFMGFEALIRFSLIVFSIKSWCKSQGPQRRSYSLLLFIYFSVSLLFAIGTTNYGTAMRHNMVSYWLIVLVGGSGLIKFVTKYILPISKSEVHNSSREITGPSSMRKCNT